MGALHKSNVLQRTAMPNHGSFRLFSNAEAASPSLWSKTIDVIATPHHNPTWFCNAPTGATPWHPKTTLPLAYLTSNTRSYPSICRSTEARSPKSSTLLWFKSQRSLPSLHTEMKLSNNLHYLLINCTCPKWQGI